MMTLVGIEFLYGKFKPDFFLDNIFIRFEAKLYRQVVGIPMSTNCAPLVADL